MCSPCAFVAASASSSLGAVDVRRVGGDVVAFCLFVFVPAHAFGTLPGGYLRSCGGEPLISFTDTFPCEAGRRARAATKGLQLSVLISPGSTWRHGAP